MPLDPITAGLEFASKIIDKIFPDKTQAEAAKLKMFEMQQQGTMQQIQNDFQLAIEQIKVNAVEAASGSKWVAGWRPAVGWVGAFALAYNYIMFPFYVYTAKLVWATAPAMPVLDNGELMTLLFALLGFGSMRSFDKKTATMDPCTQTPVAPKG
jgi:hypothetical protein